MIWSGFSLSFRPPPARPTLALRLISLVPEGLLTAALNPCAGGKLEFFDVFFGFFCCNFCSLSHSVWIRRVLIGVCELLEVWKLFHAFHSSDFSRLVNPPVEQLRKLIFILLILMED